MRCLLALLLVACSSSKQQQPAPAGEAPPVSEARPASQPPRFTWPVPEGWRGETIPFPLEFAPDIPRRGVEELRFAPGFFQPDAAGYWTYAFVWIVTDAGATDPSTLARELTTYFRGLTAAVAKDKKGLPPLDLESIEARLDSEGHGTAHTFDAFGDGRPIDLEVSVTVQPCGAGKAVLVAAARRDQPPISPAPAEVLRSFRCDTAVR